MVPVVQRSSAAAAAHQADGAHHGLPAGDTCARQPSATQQRRGEGGGGGGGGGLTLKGAALGAAGGDEVERDVWRPADVLVREAPALTFVAATHHPLAEEIRPPDDEDEQEDGDDGHDGVGPAAVALGGRLAVCNGRGRRR